MRNEETGRLRTDESRKRWCGMGMWGLERLAANNKVQTGPVGVRFGGATPFLSPMTRRSTPIGPAQGLLQ